MVGHENFCKVYSLHNGRAPARIAESFAGRAVFTVAFVPAIGDDAGMSRVWLGGIGLAVVLGFSWLWYAWRTHRHDRDGFGTISDTWINHHRARDRDHDPNR